MNVTCKTDLFRHFPQLAVDPDRFLDAIRSFLGTDAAKEHGVLDLHCRVVGDHQPELEFRIEVPESDLKDEEVEVFFPADALVLHVANAVLEPDDYQKFEDAIIDRRTKSGPNVYQRYVYRLPGPGWKPTRASRAHLYFGRMAIDMPMPFDLMVQGAEDGLTLQIPFNLGQVQAAGLDLGRRPIILAALLVGGEHAVYVLDDMIDADDHQARFCGRGNQRYDQHHICVAEVLIEADPRGLVIEAKNAVVCLKQDRALVSLGHPLMDARLKVGARCRLKMSNNSERDLQGYISGITQLVAGGDTLIQLDMPGGCRNG
jgi:hypothetical protein